VFPLVTVIPKFGSQKQVGTGQFGLTPDGLQSISDVGFVFLYGGAVDVSLVALDYSMVDCLMQFMFS